MLTELQGTVTSYSIVLNRKFLDSESPECLDFWHLQALISLTVGGYELPHLPTRTAYRCECWLGVPVNQGYVRVIMMQLLYLKRPISDVWYVLFHDKMDLNSASYAVRRYEPSPHWSTFCQISEEYRHVFHIPWHNYKTNYLNYRGLNVYTGVRPFLLASTHFQTVGHTSCLPLCCYLVTIWTFLAVPVWTSPGLSASCALLWSRMGAGTWPKM